MQFVWNLDILDCFGWNSQLIIVAYKLLLKFGKAKIDSSLDSLFQFLPI